MITETLSARERFHAMLLTGPLLKSDAIVVLAGEDAGPRLDVAAQLLMTGGAARIVLSGGKHQPPRWQGARALKATLMGKGVVHDRIIVDDASQHTREQAVNVVTMAREQGWKRLLVVASPYHIARATLTFVRVLYEQGQDQAIRVVPVPASQTAWGAAPDGMDESRMDLLCAETRKVEEYQPHVASYEDGIAYLDWWEGK